MISRLKELRRSHNLTQRELAEVLHVQQNVISYYESGQRTPGLDLLIKLSDYFDIPMDYVCERSDNPKRLTVNEEKLLFLYRELNPEDNLNKFIDVYEILSNVSDEDTHKI